MSEKWVLQIDDDPEYLDGIRSGLMVRSEEGAPIAYMFDEGYARLATAAPELLEALEDLIDAIGTHDPDWAWEERKNAREAISKATNPQHKAKA